MVICLERGADLHTAQLMPLPLTARSTQPCIPPGSLNRVPASAGQGREYHLCRVAGNTV